MDLSLGSFSLGSFSFASTNVDSPTVKTFLVDAADTEAEMAVEVAAVVAAAVVDSEEAAGKIGSSLARLDLGSLEERSFLGLPVEANDSSLLNLEGVDTPPLEGGKAVEERLECFSLLGAPDGLDAGDGDGDAELVDVAMAEDSRSFNLLLCGMAMLSDEVDWRERRSFGEGVVVVVVVCCCCD